MPKHFAQLPSVPDHPELEREILDLWEREGTFFELRDRNRGGPRFSFMDGPITANAPAGVHHGLGRTLKDVFQRYKALRGHDLRYQNGFDWQGLHVEVQVEKGLGLNSKREIEEYGIAEFARRCREFVAHFAGVQTEQSKRLGMWMDWENSYFTFSDTNIEYIWRFLKNVHDRGWLYMGHRSTQWCPRCGTSLSKHEQAGDENFELSRLHGLAVLTPIDESGRFLPAYGEYEGRTTDAIAEPVMEWLHEHELLVESGTIRHRYPVCWRCRTPLVFRVVDDWFISAAEIRQQMLAGNDEF